MPSFAVAVPCLARQQPTDVRVFVFSCFNPLAACSVRFFFFLRPVQEERYNRDFVLEDGRNVSYSDAGVPDGLPVFLFLVRKRREQWAGRCLARFLFMAGHRQCLVLVVGR